jgi:hypothetical protein
MRKYVKTFEQFIEPHTITRSDISVADLQTSSGIVGIASDLNSPETASQSPNNATIDLYDKNGNGLFFLSRVGNGLYDSLMSTDLYDEQYGDLMLIFTPDALEVKDISDDHTICTIEGKDKEEFTKWFGDLIGRHK